jgi:hypothetical protein
MDGNGKERGGGGTEGWGSAAAAWCGRMDKGGEGKKKREEKKEKKKKKRKKSDKWVTQWIEDDIEYGWTREKLI